MSFNKDKLKRNINLADYTTFKIGGKADYFFIAYTQSDIISAINWAIENKKRFFILGGGSNILFSDKGFSGLVIKLGYDKKLSDFDSHLYEGNGWIIFSVNANLSLNELIKFSLDNSLTGLEWVAGIPGTLGGAIRGNAGAFSSSMSEVIKSVECLEIMEKNGNGKEKPAVKYRIRRFLKDECVFQYRGSIFKVLPERNLKIFPPIILSAELEMKKAKREDIEKNIKKNLMERRLKQPSGHPNAGSIFKNAQIDKKNSSFEEMEDFPKEFIINKSVPAAWLIEQCNLKKIRIGDAIISEKHSNFILNLGKAKSEDVKKLIFLAKKRVRRKFKISLKEEIIIVK